MKRLFIKMKMKWVRRGYPKEMYIKINKKITKTVYLIDITVKRNGEVDLYVSKKTKYGEQTTIYALYEEPKKIFLTNGLIGESRMISHLEDILTDEEKKLIEKMFSTN